MAKLTKPPSLDSCPYKSKKWDEIIEGRNFSESDIPTLCLLCQWHKIVDQCQEDLDEFGTLIHVDDQGRPHAWPQLSTMKQASAEIRALNKQLGICDEVKTTEETEPKETPLYVVQGNREARAQAVRATRTA